MPYPFGYINDRPDNYVAYSECKQKHAMKQYRCYVTGRTIHKGELYWYIRCWNPFRNRYFQFKVHSCVSNHIRSQLRKNPEEASYLFKAKDVHLGFEKVLQ